MVLSSKPNVFNHNLETVPRLYHEVRPGSRYYQSLKILDRAKDINPFVFTKSGLMVGLGEELKEVTQVMDDLRTARVDFLTIGQYLQPTKKHLTVKDFITPEQFKEYEIIGKEMGFRHVESGPLVRSSYKAHKHIH